MADSTKVIKSVNYNQHAILRDILDLHCGGAATFDCDITISKGNFYGHFKRTIQEKQEDGCIIEKGFYGRCMCLPELYIDDEVYQLYNQSAKPYGTQEVIGKVDEFGAKYHIIEFTVSEEYNLVKLEQVDFNGLTDNNRARILRRLSLL